MPGATFPALEQSPALMGTQRLNTEDPPSQTPLLPCPLQPPAAFLPTHSGGDVGPHYLGTGDPDGLCGSRGPSWKGPSCLHLAGPNPGASLRVQDIHTHTHTHTHTQGLILFSSCLPHPFLAESFRPGAQESLKNQLYLTMGTFKMHYSVLSIDYEHDL